MTEWRQVAEGPPTAVEPGVYIESHYAVAMLYWEGKGVARDLFAARAWLEKAAALNHPGARAKLAYLYTDGVTVAPDLDKAFELFSEAARQGDVDALYNLGIFYLNGWGTEKDEVRARQYLAAASAQGDPAAEEALQQLLAQDPSLSGGPPVTDPPETPVPPGVGGPAQRHSFGASSPEGETAPAHRLRSAGDPAGIEGTQPAESGDLPASGMEGEKPLSAVAATLLDETWLHERNPEHYTLQVMALSRRERVEALVAGQDALAPWAVYTATGSRGVLHVLVQGDYADVGAARAARDAFPAAIQQPDQLWIRRFDKVQAQLER